MKYLVLSTAVTDDIYFPDGTTITGVGGGAGWYAYAGMRLWTDDALLVSGVGDDFSKIHGSWFDTNNACTGGLLVKDNHSPLTKVMYQQDGEREEIPTYGYGHYKKIEPQPEDIAPFCSDCKGMYVFKNTEDPVFWKKLLQLKEQYGFTLMWEISADATAYDNIEAVLSITSQVDIVSINLTEATSLFNVAEEKLAENFRAHNMPLVFLRKGSRGASVITKTEEVQVPSITVDKVVDPTGAGNSSSGAFLVGYCEHTLFFEMGVMGSISASYMIQQYGPIPALAQKIQEEARMTLHTYNKRLGNI